MSELFIVTDLKHFKAYRVIRDKMSSPRLELVREYENTDPHQKIREIERDEPGRFGMKQSGGSVIKGYGEKHSLEEEVEKRLIKNLAKEVVTLLKESKPSRWHLAADKRINNQLIEFIDNGLKESLKINIKADITKKEKKELLSYLESA
jgi:hypothetical protein